jgi:hypothetical protein
MGKNSNGNSIKNELLKLHNCSRETITINNGTSVTYEVLSQIMEDILKDNNFNVNNSFE